MIDWLNSSNLGFFGQFDSACFDLINLNDQIGLSLTKLSKVEELKGNWMPDSKLWFGFNYRANF